MIRTAGRFACLAAVLLVAAGCSKGGVKKAQLSGKVTFNGKPVPAGYISFAAETGPVRVAQIKDGVYDTAQEADPGVIPGLSTVRIAGFDGKPQPYYPQGKQIFNMYEIKDVGVPDGMSTRDFDVPAAAAQNLRIQPTADVP
jgi:hypothetical protein